MRFSPRLSGFRVKGERRHGPGAPVGPIGGWSDAAQTFQAKKAELGVARRCTQNRGFNATMKGAVEKIGVVRESERAVRIGCKPFFELEPGGSVDNRTDGTGMCREKSAVGCVWMIWVRWSYWVSERLDGL